MKLTMLEISYDMENNEKGVQDLIEEINKFLEIRELFFSHLVIDGKEIHLDHEEYILENLTSINEISLKVKTVKQFIGSLLVSLNEYTSRAIPEIKKLANDLYNSPSEDSWLTLNQFLEGIGWIYETIKSIDQSKHGIINWEEFIKVAALLEVELPNLLNAFENNDSILIADIIQYEVLPQFQLINEQTEKIFNVK